MLVLIVDSEVAPGTYRATLSLDDGLATREYELVLRVLVNTPPFFVGGGPETVSYNWNSGEHVLTLPDIED